MKIFSIPDVVGSVEAGRLMEKVDEITDDVLMHMEKFHQFSHKKPLFDRVKLEKHIEEVLEK